MKLWVFLVQMMDGVVPYCIGSELWPSNSSFGMSCWSWCPVRKVWTLCCQESPMLICELHLVIQPTLHLEVLPFWPWKTKPCLISKFVWTVIWAMVLQCKRYQVNTDSLAETGRALKGKANPMARGKAFWFYHFNFNTRSKGSKVLLSLTIFSCTQVFFKFHCKIIAVKSFVQSRTKEQVL